MMVIRKKLTPVAIFAFLVTACGGPAAIDTSTVPPVQRQAALDGYAEAVRASLESLSMELSSEEVAANKDLHMAWTDLEADMQSVVNDLLRDPESVDTVGVQRRVESFGVLVTESTDVSMPTDLWQEFILSLSNFVKQAGSA